MAALGTGGGRESTEWEDILKEKGIIPEKSEEQLAEEKLREVVEDSVARYDPHEAKAVDELDEELEDADSEEERILQKYRDRRLAELKEESQRRKYGPGVKFISASEWKEEVTDAPRDAYVVVFLFNDNIEASRHWGAMLSQLSSKFVHTKFVQCKAADAIKNYPDSKVPTILVYHNKQVLRNFIGPGSFKGPATTADDVERELGKLGAVDTQLQEEPSASTFNLRRI